MSNLEPSSKGPSRWLSGREPACDAGDAICLIPGLEDPLEEGMATHSSILAWRIPMDSEAWQATVHGVTKKSNMTEGLNTQHILRPAVPLTLSPSE